MDAGLPNITGQVGVINYINNGAFKYNGTNHGIQWAGGSNAGQADFDASRLSSVYGSSGTVTPLSLSYIPIIRY